MPHFYVNPKNIHNERFSIQGEECHHLQHVLRKKIGDIIQLFDGQHHTYQGVIESILPAEIAGTIIQKNTKQEENFQIHLFQALPKGNKFDFIIEKCTELGVSSITPIITARCIKRVSPEESSKKIDRWGKIAHSAAEQCGRTTIPVIHQVKNFTDAIKQSNHNTIQFLPWEGEEKCLLKEALRRQVKIKDNKLQTIRVWIGPEGGFSPQEITTASEQGVKTVTLGKRILRTETAGLITLALIQYELDIL